MSKATGINSTGEVLLYKNKVEVRLDKETVWLSQAQIAGLFGVDRTVITKHLKNVFISKEVDKKSNVQKMHFAFSDKPVAMYGLDVVISVGYRVNSSRATQFRIWATNILKKHLIDGYTINEKRLKITEHKYQELQKAVNLLSNVIHLDGIADETKGLIKVITEYSQALNVLDDYDHARLSAPKGVVKARFILTYENAREIIEAMREKFSDSNLVGQEKDKSFQSSINAIYQTFSGKDLYPTVEEKAAHLLYFVTKNHSFVDGNKRIAAALFVCFLQKNGILLRKNGSYRIDNNALVALTLMIAASRPQDKEMMIKVVLNLLGN